ncbi:MRN complex-interacting protein isoform X2 [Ambystoma mexicanum]
MLQGEMLLSAETMAGSFDVPVDCNDDHTEQKENQSLQHEVSPSTSRWSKYAGERMEEEGMYQEEEESEGSAYTTDRQQFYADRKNTSRSHRKRGQSDCGYGVQQYPDQSGIPEVSRGVTKTGSWQAWKDSTPAPSQGHNSPTIENVVSPCEVTKPEKNLQQALLSCEQPCSTHSKWGRFLSPVSHILSSEQEAQQACEPSGTPAMKAFFHYGAQHARENCTPPDKGESERKYMGHTTDGQIIKPCPSSLLKEHTTAVTSITVSNVTGFSRTPLPAAQMWKAPEMGQLDPPVASSQFGAPASAVCVNPFSPTGKVAYGGLFQTDEDFDDHV